jgi:hypothetical protein
MECLKSFNLHSSTSVNASNAYVWTQNGNNYWVVESNLSSAFNIQGFKNVNIHGIELVGDMQSFQPNVTDNCILQDWSTTIQLQGGTIPQVSGQIQSAPNQWALDNTSAFARIFTLGKSINKINFASPFESVKSIRFLGYNANGLGAQINTGVSLKWNLQWIFYYTYEGEQY